MITKNDCLNLLASLDESGIDVSEQILKVVNEGKPSLDVLKFINDHRPLRLGEFYEMLRKSYNNKKSTVYINIMKEEQTPCDVLTTLNAYAMQVLLFSSKLPLEEISLFKKFARLSEVYKVLYIASNDESIKECIDLLSMIKADIKCLEQLYRK